VETQTIYDDSVYLNSHFKHTSIGAYAVCVRNASVKFGVAKSNNLFNEPVSHQPQLQLRAEFNFIMNISFATIQPFRMSASHAIQQQLSRSH